MTGLIEENGNGSRDNNNILEILLDLPEDTVEPEDFKQIKSRTKVLEVRLAKSVHGVFEVERDPNDPATPRKEGVRKGNDGIDPEIVTHAAIEQMASNNLFSMKAMAGELRWIESKDKPLELRMMIEARKMEDMVHQERKKKAKRNARAEEERIMEERELNAAMDRMMEEMENDRLGEELEEMNLDDIRDLNEAMDLMEEDENGEKGPGPNERNAQGLGEGRESSPPTTLKKRWRNGHTRYKPKVIHPALNNEIVVGNEGKGEEMSTSMRMIKERKNLVKGWKYGGG